ncbi:MAG: hypothetical protein AB7V50_09030 [Vampirovibrionia bacterium]
MTKKALTFIFITLFLSCNYVVAKRISPEIPDKISNNDTANSYNSTILPNLDLFQPKTTDTKPKFKKDISTKQSLLDILNNSIK